MILRARRAKMIKDGFSLQVSWVAFEEELMVMNDATRCLVQKTTGKFRKECVDLVGFRGETGYLSAKILKFAELYGKFRGFLPEVLDKIVLERD